MLRFAICCLFLISIKTNARPSDSTSSVNVYEDLIKRSFEKDFPVYVLIDSTHYLIGDARYDKDYRAIYGKFLRSHKAIVYPNLSLGIKDYSTLSNNTDQIRLLDIKEAAIVHAPFNTQERKKDCNDRMILSLGDTITCRVIRISDDHIDYKKCKHKIKRTFGKDKFRVSKIIYANGTEQIISSVDESATEKKKKARIITGIGVTIGFGVVFGLFRILVATS